MANFFFCTANIGMFSAAIGLKTDVTSVMFYANVVLLFFALLQTTSLIVLYKKTACAAVIGLAPVMLFFLGIILFFAQLVLYIYVSRYAMYVVYFCLAVMYCGFILSCVYGILLSRNAYGGLCVLAGVFCLVPPVGSLLFMAVSYKIRKDTRVKELVYNGYALTYATLDEFSAQHPAEFVDMSGDEQAEMLSGKEIKAKLKSLKKAARTPDGKYEYAAALATYAQKKRSKAVKLMKKAAAGGNAAALFNVGYYREKGAYMKMDIKKAKALYARAAALGDNDAAMRLCILEIQSGQVEAGMSKLQARADGGDLCAVYNLGICKERGIGGEPDVLGAVEVYARLAADGLYIAQKRIFAIASKDINSAQNGDFFRKVTDRKFSGTLAIMIDGLIEVKKRHAADAADKFLLAVRQKDKWQGAARCILGALYIDCGKLPADRGNGAEYIRSALGICQFAKSVYDVIPFSVLSEAKKQRRAAMQSGVVHNTQISR